MINEPADERRARELVKLIRKLRWIGEHDEAKELENNLRSDLRRDCILAAPGETE